MHSVIFSKLCIAVFTVVLLFIFTNSFDIDNHQDIPDIINFINGSYKQENLKRSARQNTPTCRIPKFPSHTLYNVIGELQTQVGNNAENFNIMQITCEEKFSIKPIAQNHSICINGEWTPPLTSCLRTCPSLHSIASTNIKCKWTDNMGNRIPLSNCIYPVEGTIAYLSCNSGYEEPNIKKNPIRVCKQGKWDPHITECYPICGVKHPKRIPNAIINSTNVEPEEYPWQIGIYNSQKEFQCGGSILDYNVILSAAHCFTGFDGTKKPTENYLVAAGKYYRKYDDERDKLAQYSKILKIHIPSKYKGITNLQGFDIAVLILTNPLKISPAVQPICIGLDEESKSFNFTLQKYGIVTGWGYKENGKELSDVLKKVVIPYIPYEECFQKVPLDFRRFITHDKICGGYVNSSTGVCGGDSGGGYIFKNFDSDRHFVKGIVSVSPATLEGVCDPNQFGVYTFVDEHINFIRLHLTYNQIHLSLECKQDNCYEELQSEEDCSNSNGFPCGIEKIRCRLPDYPLNGTYYIRNQTQTYTPGGYAEINNVLVLRCYTGFLSKFKYPSECYCSDKGEWSPPLRTCEDKPGYCSVAAHYLRNNTQGSLVKGSCGAIICANSTTNKLIFITCESTSVCPFNPHDYTKLFPDCCPKNSCFNNNYSIHEPVWIPVREVALISAGKKKTSQSSVARVFQQQ